MKKLKYQQLCQTLKAQIVEGFWKSGNKIYSERQLAILHNISRPTVKQALSELISEGLLEYRPGRQGIFVSGTNNSSGKLSIEKRNERFIGVAVDNHTPAFASYLLQGIHDALWDNGFHTIYCNTYHENELIFDRIQSLMNTSISGIIYSPVLGQESMETNMRIQDAMKEKCIPVVLVDRYIPERLNNHVVINNREIFHELVSLLLNRGHSRILFINGFEATSSLDRLKGFHDAFEKSGTDPSGALEINLDEQDFFQTGLVPDEAIKEVEKMGNFTVLIGLNQQLLEAGMQIAKKLKIKIITATTVASHREKNSDLAVVQPIFRMGHEAAKLLIKIIEDKSLPVTHLTLKAHIQDNRDE